MLILTAVGILAAAAWRYRKPIMENFAIARYELLYWVLGSLAVGDDLIWGWWSKLKESPKKTGEVALITGGNRGIGLETVKVLLQCDMTVVIGCRSVESGEAAVRSIRAAGITTGQTDVLPLDTSSQAGVKKFADVFCAKYKKIHLLINNAGIMFGPFQLTEDGFESQLAVNFLGHFTLTHLLLPTLVRTAREAGKAARIVNVSSCAHLPGAIYFDDIHFERTQYIASKAYAQSKLAQIMFAKSVDRRLKNKKLPVNIYAIHPGVVNTELFNGTFLKRIMPWAPNVFFKTPEQGAVTSLYAALSPDVENKSGIYLANCRETFISPAAGNEEQQERLMEVTSKMLKIEDFGQLSSI